MSQIIFDNDFLKKLNAIKLAVKSKSNSNFMGGRKSNAKGSSVEFSDYREYNLGDDLRRVDWNAYGRFEKIFIKLYSEEREGVFNIFLDTSESMKYGEKSKREMALKITGGLVYMILNSLDRVGVNLVQNGELSVSKGKTGLYNYYPMLNELSQIEFGGSTGFKKALSQFSFNTRGVAILISDFYEIDELEDVMKFLTYNKQEIMLVRILSEEDINPELEGALNLIDSESESRSYKVDISPSLLRAYKKSYEDFTIRLQNLSKKYGASLSMVSTGESFEKVLLNLGR